MKNLYNLECFELPDVLRVINLALKYKQGLVKNFSNFKVVNLFFEPSTRTHYSFTAAQQNFNMKVTNVNLDYSSVKKGESLYDTVKTFQAIGYDLAVIRHPQNTFYEELSSINIPIINGGDGTGNHPTQALLDLMTIYEKFGKFDGLKIVIVGDIVHSRVAHTNAKIMRKLGMDVFVCGPKELSDKSASFIEFDDAVKEADVIMLLRVQSERHGYPMTMSNEEYFEKFGLKQEHVLQMKRHSIIMHPAPFNRDVEIASKVVECEKSCIFTQMENGVFVRMALIDMVLSNDS